MKYRVKEDDGSFKPQYKGWFFWHTFQFDYSDFSFDERFSTLSGAKNFIDKHIEDKANYKPKITTYHRYP